MNTFIFDVGKTNVKAYVLDDVGKTLWERKVANSGQTSKGYLSFDTDRLWDWLKMQLATAHRDIGFSRINVSTHGACAALVDNDGALCLPVLDYEDAQPQELADEYDEIRPKFADTLSPRLELGLNLGLQLYWLKRRFSDEFDRCHAVLMYPQYWSYRLTGVLSSEVTSLGCHTDMWNPFASSFSTLIDALGLEGRMPPLVAATEPLGVILPELADELALLPGLEVFPGVHDSNSGLARYLYADLATPYNVISSGTWIITMAVGQLGGELDEARDTLANVDVLGQPIPCARFMGGREFSLITESLAGAQSEMSVAEHIDQLALIVPPVVGDTGPFAGADAGVRLVCGEERKPVGDLASFNGLILATLYLAMMIDYELSMLGAKGPILFGSTSSKNPLLCQLLAQLRPEQAVLMANDDASTVKGAWCLTRWVEPCPDDLNCFERAQPSSFSGLSRYRNCWAKGLL